MWISKPDLTPVSPHPLDKNRGGINRRRRRCQFREEFRIPAQSPAVDSFDTIEAGGRNPRPRMAVEPLF
jgi:hypothetical protein